MGPAGPAHGDAGEGFGDEEAIPGVDDPGALGFEMECADGRAGELGELDGARLGAIDGSARTVGGEDGGRAALDDLLEAEEAVAAAGGAGAARGMETEELEGAGDELAVEALADDDGGVGAAEVEGAGEHALMPEAEYLGGCAIAFGEGNRAVFGEDFKAPGAADGRQQRPDEAGHEGEDETLAKSERRTRLVGH